MTDRVWLVRHAATAWAGERWCGRTDLPLSATGVMEAETLARRLATQLPAAIDLVCSPALRARQTAEPIVRALQGRPDVDDRVGGIDLVVDRGLWEVDFGRAEGCSWADIERLFPQLAADLASANTAVDWPGGETADEVQRRAHSAWRRLAKRSRPVVAVCHGGIIRAMLEALGLRTGSAQLWSLAPAGFVELHRSGGAWSLRASGDGRRGGPIVIGGLEATIARIGPLDEEAASVAAERLDRLTKPRGSLGRLEELVAQLAAITGDPAPTFERRAIVVAAADHGVTAQGVSAYPSEVTRQMVATIASGGAAINVLARMVRADVVLVDVGVAGPELGDASEQSGLRARILGRRVRPGTADLSVGPAMSRDEALAAIDVGLAAAQQLREEGFRLVGLGELGIGNTTAAAAIVAALTGRPPNEVTGRGTGLDDAGWRRKVAVVERSLDVNRPDPADPLGVLAAVGGLEIALLVGLALGAAAEGVPVIVDGYISAAAALLATRLCPALRPRLIAAHRSAEPGHALVLEALGLRPLLELDLRLGEGTGAALAITIVDAAVRIRDEMATFESAGVAQRNPAR